MRFLAFLFVCILFSIEGHAQPFPMLHFGVEDGLPSDRIYSIYKDHNDILWIATDKGIARYNGIKFEVFTTFNGLSDNEIFFFQEDRLGRLWMATYNGELCYYQNDTFHTAQNTPFLKTEFRPRSYIKCIYPEYDGSVTITFNSEFNFLSIGNNYCRVENVDHLFRNRNESLAYERKISTNAYDIFCTGMVMTVDTAAHMVATRQLPFRPGFFLQNNDQYYLIHGFSFFSIDRQTDTVKVPELKHSSNRISCIYFNGKQYFILTNDAVYYNKNHLLFYGKASTVAADSRGNYWFGTLNKGIYILDSTFERTSLHNKAYMGVAKFSQCMGSKTFFSTDSAICYYENGNVNTIYRHSKYYDSEPAALINNKDDFYYFCSESKIVIRNISSANRKISAYGISENGYKKLVWANNMLYVQQRNCILINNTQRVPDGVLQPLMQKNSRIYCMAQSDDHTVWYATRNNLYRIREYNKIDTLPLKTGLKHIEFASNCMAGILNNNTFLLIKDINNKFLIDTIAPQNCIWEKLYKLDASHILISTNNLYRLLTIRNDNSYDIRIVEDPFIPVHTETFCTDNQKCYFFKDQSITTINKERLFRVPQPPRLNYTLLQTENRVYRMQDKLTISYLEAKKIAISFTSLSFGGRNIQYQYSLSKNGVENWGDVQQEKININNPDYGEYVLKVRARSLSSAFSTPVIFYLTIEKPLWITWWFLSIAAVALTLTIFIIARMLAWRVIAKKEQEHNIKVMFIKSEYKALNALMNPHFIFNTLNNLQSLFNADDKRMANKYLRVFANLIRQNMHNLAEEEITLQKEIDLLTNYLMLEKMRFGDRLEYSINVQHEVDVADIMIPPLLVQPLVENSIKHGLMANARQKGIIELHISERNNALIIQVRNSKQKGELQKQNAHESIITDDTLHKPFGLHNIQTRLEQLGIIRGKKIMFTIAEIEDEHTAGLYWTTVTIILPLN